jgi:AraC-like DNA-binding protein
MRFGTTPLLTRHRVFRSQDAEETRAFLRGKQFGFDVAPREVAGLDACLNGIYLPGMYLGYLHYGAAVAVRAAPSRDDGYWIHIPLRGSIEMSSAGNTFICNPACGAVCSPTHDDFYLTRQAQGSARVHMMLSRAAVTRQLEALLGDQPGALLEFAASLDLAGGHGQSLARYILLAVSEFEQAGAMNWNPITVSLFEQFIISKLLLSQQHTYSQALQHAALPVVPRDVKRALDFIEAHLDAPITLADIVAAAGIPGRTLFKHFEDHRGVSPMRYVRMARLKKARDDLRRADPQASVTDIAMKWGFGHLGRFAVEYRRRFGESPSQTLRRRVT